MDAGRKRQLAMLRWSAAKKAEAEQPPPEEEHYTPWKHTPEWDQEHNIPRYCPKCGLLALRNGCPFEIWCPAHGDVILPWVPVPKGWRPAPQPTRSVIIV